MFDEADEVEDSIDWFENLFLKTILNGRQQISWIISTKQRNSIESAKKKRHRLMSFFLWYSIFSLRFIVIFWNFCCISYLVFNYKFRHISIEYINFSRSRVSSYSIRCRLTSHFCIIWWTCYQYSITIYFSHSRWMFICICDKMSVSIICSSISRS